MPQVLFFSGLIASIVLVLGSAWPKSKTKDRLFLVGNFGMLAYALLGYIQGAPIFYIFLELLCVSSSVMFFLNIKEKKASHWLLALGTILLLCSLYFLESTNTLFFILGLISLALGFVSRNEKKQNTLFILGSLLIALFSWVENSMIFFWLNAIFGLFSSYHLLKALKKD